MTMRLGMALGLSLLCRGTCVKYAVLHSVTPVGRCTCEWAGCLCFASSQSERCATTQIKQCHRRSEQAYLGQQSHSAPLSLDYLSALPMRFRVPRRSIERI